MADALRDESHRSTLSPRVDRSREEATAAEDAAGGHGAHVEREGQQTAAELAGEGLDVQLAYDGQLYPSPSSRPVLRRQTSGPTPVGPGPA